MKGRVSLAGRRVSALSDDLIEHGDFSGRHGKKGNESAGKKNENETKRTWWHRTRRRWRRRWRRRGSSSYHYRVPHSLFTISPRGETAVIHDDTYRAIICTVGLDFPQGSRPVIGLATFTNQYVRVNVLIYFLYPFFLNKNSQKNESPKTCAARSGEGCGDTRRAPTTDSRVPPLSPSPVELRPFRCSTVQPRPTTLRHD